MKKLLYLTLAVGFGFVLGVLCLGLCLKAQAGTGTATATSNGDTNGDGSIDISDAVYLLNFLFAGGGNIAEISCPASQTSLVATGQTECVGEQGTIDCTAPKARGQDAFHQAGCPAEGRFVDNGDGTINDNCTGLMWTKTHVDVNNDGEITLGDGFMNPSVDEKKWLDACNFAEDMTYLGYDDWRVPNVQELLSIVNFGSGLSTGGPWGPLYDGFDFDSDGRGTWSSTYIMPQVAISMGLVGRGFSCDCCVLRNISSAEYHLFVAVRG
jgi:hypothetical protein